LNDVLMM